MSDPVMKKASLADIQKLKDEGKLFHDPKAPEGEHWVRISGRRRMWRGLESPAPCI